MKRKRKRSLVGYAIYRKCRTYPDWSLDIIYPNEDGFKESGKRRAKYYLETHPSDIVKTKIKRVFIKLRNSNAR